MGSRETQSQGQASRGEYLATLDDVAFGAATPVEPKFVSQVDPAARRTASEKKMKSGEEGSGDNAASDQMQNSGATGSGTETAPSQAEQQNVQSTTEKSSGDTKSSVNITEKQTTEIRTVIKEDNVEPVDVDFDVNVGVSVPDTVELHQLPPRIVEIVPEYEGYVFFVSVSGQIIIVDPDTRDIVYIIVT